VLALLDAPGFWDADSSQEERKISLTPLARTNADAMQCASPCTAAVRQDPSGPSHRIASHRIASHRIVFAGQGQDASTRCLVLFLPIVTGLILARRRITFSS
jgi:hypothetical protein